MAWAVSARALVEVTADGRLTYSAHPGEARAEAIQFARRQDAERFVALARRIGIETYGRDLHVVDLGG